MGRKKIMSLCRLCLKEDQVDVSIFEEQPLNEDQIHFKINTCLPVTVSKTDNLPKKICEECSSKLGCFYQFWHDTLKAEKQLNLWVMHFDLDDPGKDHQFMTSIDEESTQNESIVDGIKQESMDSDDEETIDNMGTSRNSDTKNSTLFYQDVIHSKRGGCVKAMKKILECLSNDNDEDISENVNGKSDDNEEESENRHYLRRTCSRLKASSEKGARIEDSLNSINDNTQNSNHLVPIVELSEGSWLHNEDISNPFAPQIHTTLKKLGYKNPFVYPELKNKRKALKKFESWNNTKWQCMICSDIKSNKSELMEHYESHKKETETLKGNKYIGDYFMCPVCLTDFTSLISYEKHVELNHGEKQYNCEICHKAFKNLYSLSVHNHKRHSTEKFYKCSGCDFEDDELKSLRNHIRTAHEEHVKYRCEICNKGFSSISWYQEHKNFHTGAMPFECEICSKSFPYTRYLIAHKKSMHPEMFSSVPINHECEICQKKFAHKKSLILHLRGHSGESAVLCDMCGKSLSSSEHLKQHLRIHTGYKPHCCSVCGKGFAKKCNLTLHERVHSGEKPHICNVCGKGFSQRSTLVIHGRYHSGERPYQCQLCKKGFVAKGLLGVHMKTCIGVPG